jgi:hypothetical protein
MQNPGMYRTLLDYEKPMHAGKDVKVRIMTILNIYTSLLMSHSILQLCFPQVYM